MLDSAFRFTVFFGIVGAVLIGSSVTIWLRKKFPILDSLVAFRWLFAFFLLLSVFDMHSTYCMVSWWGNSVEMSPVPYWMFETFGFFWTLVLRFMLLTPILYFLFKKYIAVLLCIEIIYPFVVIWNYWQIAKSSISLFPFL